MTIDDVRLLIPDTDLANPSFSDAQIESFLRLNGDNVYLAVADALDVIATDETLVYKIVRTDDQTVNGVTGAEQIRLRAKEMRDRATRVEDADFTVQYTYPLVSHRTEGLVPPWC